MSAAEKGCSLSFDAGCPSICASVTGVAPQAIWVASMLATVRALRVHATPTIARILCLALFVSFGMRQWIRGGPVSSCQDFPVSRGALQSMSIESLIVLGGCRMATTTRWDRDQTPTDLTTLAR